MKTIIKRIIGFTLIFACFTFLCVSLSVKYGWKALYIFPLTLICWLGFGFLIASLLK